MTVDTKKLRELAEKATPGPWAIDSDHIEYHLSVYPDRPPGQGRSHIVSAVEFKSDQGRHDIRYVAAADPQTVIALLDDNAQLRAACEKWQNHFTDTPGLAAANAEIVSLRSRLAKVERENEQLRDENMEQASQLLDPNATCCADATRKTKELREAHANELAQVRELLAAEIERSHRYIKALDEACRIATNWAECGLEYGSSEPEARIAIARVAELRKVGAT